MEKLTQKEAKRLLNMLKKTLVSQINFPKRGEKQVFEVMGESRKDLFVINIYKGNINNKKVNFGARIKKNNIMLLELHLGATNKHVNPNGEKNVGSHWHVYSEKHGTREAFLAEDINSDDFVEKTIIFLQKFNVIEKPKINYQLELM